MPVERFDDGGGVLGAERRHESGRDLEIGRHAHFRNRDDGGLDQLVADLAPLQRIGQRVTDLFADAQLTLRRTFAD